MPRQSKPHWFPARKCWRFRNNNQTHYSPRAIGPTDEAGAWRWVNSLSTAPTAAPVEELTVADVRELYLQHLEGRVAWTSPLLAGAAQMVHPGDR